MVNLLDTNARQAGMNGVHRVTCGPSWKSDGGDDVVSTPGFHSWQRRGRSSSIACHSFDTGCRNSAASVIFCSEARISGNDAGQSHRLVVGRNQQQNKAWQETPEYAITEMRAEATGYFCRGCRQRSKQLLRHPKHRPSGQHVRCAASHARAARMMTSSVRSSRTAFSTFPGSSSFSSSSSVPASTPCSSPVKRG